MFFVYSSDRPLIDVCIIVMQGEAVAQFQTVMNDLFTWNEQRTIFFVLEKFIKRRYCVTCLTEISILSSVLLINDNHRNYFNCRRLSLLRQTQSCGSEVINSPNNLLMLDFFSRTFHFIKFSETFLRNKYKEV